MKKVSKIILGALVLLLVVLGGRMVMMNNDMVTSNSQTSSEQAGTDSMTVTTDETETAGETGVTEQQEQTEEENVTLPESQTTETEQEDSNSITPSSLSLLRQVAIASLPNVSAYAAALNQEALPSSQGSTTASTASSKGKLVSIDAGHQDHGVSATEPNGPGSSSMKAKVTSGTTGVATGIAEYVINLEVSLKLRDELVSRGYEVHMIRETHDVEISNAERAQMANEAGADIFVRIHCNSSDSSSVNGALMYQPSTSNPYLSQDVIAKSQRLSALLLEYQIAETGQRNAGILTGDDMTGINWAQMPVSIVEMGFMSNPEEDRFLASETGQAQIVEGLANGIDAYFAEVG